MFSIFNILSDIIYKIGLQNFASSVPAGKSVPTTLFLCLVHPGYHTTARGWCHGQIRQGNDTVTDAIARASFSNTPSSIL